MDWLCFDVVLDCTVAMDSDAEKCLEPESTFQHVQPLNLWSSVWPSGLNTPKSGPGNLITMIKH